jgi:hypothetical protein
MFVALSAFMVLYQSYRAREYLRFLGQQAKKGMLTDEYLPFVGWPRKRIKAWWRNSWVCPWFRRALDLLEPWVLLPFLFTFMWMTGLLTAWSELSTSVAVPLSVILSALILLMSCIGLAWPQGKDEERTEG